MEDNNEEDLFITSSVDVSIPDYVEKLVDRKQVTFYNVNVVAHYSKKTWVVEKRYSEFEQLHKNLIEILSNVPEIPKKTLFKVTSVEALTKRKNELEKFIKDCVDRRDILTSFPFKEFIELEKNAPELIGNRQTLEGQLENIPLGVRDFYYSPKEGVIFLVCSEMNILQRTDTRIANIKMPWENNDAHCSNGAAFVYRVQKLGIGYTFALAWSKSFIYQTGILNWNSESQIFSIGLDDGTVSLNQLQPHSNFETFEEIMNLKIHKDRVMGIAIDNANNQVFSCSTDKMFYLTEISKSGVPSEVHRSNSGYTNLLYDKDNKRMFLTNETGEIEIYSNKVLISLIIVIACSSLATIRGLHIDNPTFNMFTCNVLGNVNVFDLGKPTKEKFIKEMSHFGTKAKLRIIRYDKELNCLFTGDEGGRVMVWNLITGKPLYAWLAHPKSAITQMYFEEDKRLLWTGAKDKKILIWKLPERWESKEVNEFETTGMKEINADLHTKNIQKNLKRVGNDSDSDFDDLNGWDSNNYV